MLKKNAEGVEGRGRFQVGHSQWFVFLSEAKNLCNLPAVPMLPASPQIPSTSTRQALQPANKCGPQDDAVITRNAITTRDRFTTVIDRVPD